MMNVIRINSPLGDIFIGAKSGLISFLSFEKHEPTQTCDVLKLASKQLSEYFQGSRTEFDLPLEKEGTSFQVEAWQALQKIPYGETASYKDQALMMGDIKKARAVGSANGKNPLPIIIPCHRVIRSDGELGGYSCGIEKKVFLLELESKVSGK
ncbi:MAG: methylated-DNA--[protein]-cysteine S-methyltransferase [Bacteriovoracaceae bacterium]|nr:methylated-DNA--[protein]-cysteine S-methyltransferase [Bacteriovoracaceae bacterium]